MLTKRSWETAQGRCQRSLEDVVDLAIGRNSLRSQSYISTYHSVVTGLPSAEMSSSNGQECLRVAVVQKIIQTLRAGC